MTTLWLLTMFVVGTDTTAYTADRYPTEQACKNAGQEQVSRWTISPGIYPVCKPVTAP